MPRPSPRPAPLRAPLPALALAVAAAISLSPTAARADETFGLSFAVAEEEKKPVQPDAWLEAQLAAAEKLFAPIGVHFRWTVRKTLAPEHTRLETRHDRDVLEGQLEPGVVNVFVVASLRDVDDPSLYRMGVCWRRGNEGKPYLVVSAAARPTVLAHELGHFFGNPHSKTPDNIMSYDRSGADVFFDDAQIRTVRVWAKRHVAERWILPVGVAKFLP
jgi:hypothetical protein